MTTPASYHPADPESVFTYGAPHLKFGHGAADEIGYDLSLTGARRVLVVTDPGVAATGNPQRVADQMGQFGIEAHVFEGSHVEPTDESLLRAIDYARESGPWDAYVAVGRRLEHRHRQGDQPADDQPRRADGLHQRAGRRRQGPGQPAQAADRRADDHRHRLREHDDLRDGRALAEGQDGHQPRPPAPHARRDRPLAHAHPARRRDRRRRHGHPVPRPRELHRAALHVVRAQAARAAGAVLRLQPDRGHVVREGAEPARRVLPHAPCTTATTRTPGA